MNRQSSTSSLSGLDKTWYGDIQPTTSHSVTTTPSVATAPLPSSLGHSSSSGSSVIAAAASQAIAATQQVCQLHLTVFSHFFFIHMNVYLRCSKEDVVLV